jgi:cellulase/cellobiase CelA1
MLRIRRTSTLVCVLVAMLLPATVAAHGPHPLVAKQQWIDCTTGHMRGAAPYSVWPDLWAAQRAGDSYRVALLERIAHVPQAKWLAGKNVRQEPSRIIGTYVRNTISPEWGGPNCNTRYGARGGAGDPFVGNYPIFAIRQLEHLDCGSGYHGGNDWNTARNGKYLPWIERFVDALRPIGYNAAVIVEPDGLPVIPKCLSRRAGKERLGLMRATLRRLGSVPNLVTYIDAGSSSWLKRGKALRLLRRAGVRHVRGFALNSTHFNYTRDELRYGNWLARRLGKHYVINTAENGRGPLRIKNPNKRNIKNRFCNPKNAGLGALPTTRTRSKYADAYLWISRPGLSSNGHSGMRQCSRGPGGNIFWAPKAHQEARLAIFPGQPPWPPKPL